MTALRLLRQASHRLPFRTPARTVSSSYPTVTTPKTPTTANTSTTNETPAPKSPHTPVPISETVEAGELARHQQAPNRTTTWSRSQQPRELGMVGPRFEQTIIQAQPAPWAAIELIHQQPVRWSKERVVACDGGGGPTGHPKVFINVDKPIVEPCGYCGLPYAHVKNRKAIEQAGADYPLE
ncbi:hypothetical protein EX30DRAFT_338292 [Ascodesmis nigricans]|uniref:Zinc finger CHCC-type domain-containing protein n=1 Tax=Ascodesmis nigricans TaxID=341454 RepID=A0A4S2N386_9PEZI|nr:hypothetical protein EX30DRAFT_338292 [Ascodesmis nigricans]